MTGYVPHPDDDRAAVRQVLIDNGADSEPGLHASWRCFDKVRYPDDCTCIDEAVSEVLAAVAPSIAAHARQRWFDLILRGEPEGPAAIHFCYFCDDLWESEPTCEHYQRLRDRADQIEGKT